MSKLKSLDYDAPNLSGDNWLEWAMNTCPKVKWTRKEYNPG